MNDYNLAGRSILIVDDVRTTRIAMLTMLKHCGDPMTHHAENGHEALSILESLDTPVDCVVSDFNMPVMHGLQMAKRIRVGHGVIRRETPIVMVTGHGDRNLFGIALAMDVNAFLLKPVRKDDLLARICRSIKNNESDDSWIKPSESYHCIDVDTSIRTLLNKPSVSIKETRLPGDKSGPGQTGDARAPSMPDSRVAQVIAQHQNKARVKIIHHSGVEADAPFPAPLDSSDSSAKAKTMRTIAIKLDKAPVNSILGRDVHGSQGRKLVADGTKLSPNLLARLKDLRDCGEPIIELHVRVKSKP